MNLLETLQKMQQIGAPCVAVDTADQMTTAAELRKALNGNLPLLQWDCVRGLVALNNKGDEAYHEIASKGPAAAPGAPNPYRNPVLALTALEHAPEDSICLFINAHRFIGDAGVLQAIMNLRDLFKSNNRVLVMLGAGLKLPIELQADVLTIDVPLPTAEEVSGIVSKLYADNQIEAAPEILVKSVDALRGLPGFSVEQAAAMAVKPDGSVDVGSMWERKKHAIEEVDGLRFSQPTQGFEVVGGNENWKAFFRALAKGPERPRLIVRIDEMEKQLAGAGGDQSIGDSSGVSQDAHQEVLNQMERRGYVGIINYGIAGCSKSWIGQAAAAELACPLIDLDFGAMRHGIVGESEQAVRRAFKTLAAVGGEGSGVYFVATVNSVANISGPLMRRFADGVYFFDLPEAEERSQIGAIQAKLWNVKDDEAFWLLDAAGWSGANIRDCCRLAYRMNCSIKEAAAHVVAAGQQMRSLREQLQADADQKYKSASYPGLFHRVVAQGEPTAPARKISLRS